MATIVQTAIVEIGFWVLLGGSLTQWFILIRGNCKDHQNTEYCDSNFPILIKDTRKHWLKTIPFTCSIVYPLFPPTSQNTLIYVQYDEWFWKMYFFLDKYFERCTSWWDLINIFPWCLAITQAPQAVGGPILSDYYLCFFSLCQKLILYINIYFQFFMFSLNTKDINSR